jgi:geranylgeranyl diphosphate synthase type II
LDSVDSVLANRADSPAGEDEFAGEWSAVQALMQELAVDGVQGVLADAAAYHLAVGGKGVRGRLALQAGRAYGASGPDRVAVAAACELVHNASLVHDDLQDGDRHRRGQETVWCRFGNWVALCLGDHLLSAAFRAVARAGPQDGRLVDLFGDRVADLSSGQAEEAAFRESGSRVDWAGYQRVAGLKTAPLLSLPLEAGLALTGSHPEAGASSRSFARGFGIAYQINDDLEDLFPTADPLSSESADWLPNVHAVRALMQGEGEQRTPSAARSLAIEQARTHLDEAEASLIGLSGDLGGSLRDWIDRMRRVLAA